MVVLIYPKDANWNEFISLFPKIPGARQIFDISVESAQDSCGMSIPFYEYKGEEGISRYWEDKNLTSIDGKPTTVLK
jgi:hypothetical protein